MSLPTKKIGLADLIKETIEDLALTRAIRAGLETKVIVPSTEFKTNLVQKRKLEFLQSFLDDFARVKDSKTKAEIFKMVAQLSSGKAPEDQRNISTRDEFSNFSCIKIGSYFVCISTEKDKTVMVRVVSRKEITKYFLKAN